MGSDGVIRRRVAGAVFLALALALLVLGETILKTRLSAPVFLVYWLCCFVLTCLAMVVAFRDVRATQRRMQTQQRELLDETLKKIERDAGEKGRGLPGD